MLRLCMCKMFHSQNHHSHSLWDVQRTRHPGRGVRQTASPNTFPEALWRRRHQWEGRSHSGRQHQRWRAWARFRMITRKSACSHQSRQGFICLETQAPQEWVQPCGLPLVVLSYLPSGRRLPPGGVGVGWLFPVLQFLPWKEGGALRGKMAPGSPAAVHVTCLEWAHWNPVPPGTDFLSTASQCFSWQGLPHLSQSWHSLALNALCRDRLCSWLRPS